MCRMMVKPTAGRRLLLTGTLKAVGKLHPHPNGTHTLLPKCDTWSPTPVTLPTWPVAPDVLADFCHLGVAVHGHQDLDLRHVRAAVQRQHLPAAPPRKLW